MPVLLKLCKAMATVTGSTVTGSGYVNPQPFLTVQALNTTFTPPASCFAPTFTLSPLGNDAFGSISDLYSVERGYTSACYAANTSASVVVTASRDGVVYTTPVARYYYSPGNCPTGYTTASAAFTTYIGVSLSATTIPGDILTQATCCPSVQSG